METEIEKPVVEPEHRGPIWLHPYFMYVALTILLFIFIVGMGWFAWKSGLIPNKEPSH